MQKPALMNIAVDFGNTIAKVGIFEHEILARSLFFKTAADLKVFLGSQPTENIIVSSVSHPANEVLSWSTATALRIALTAQTPFPVKIVYKTPATLGVDRIAAVCGALDHSPGEDCLVIDAGTCITFEFLDADGVYHGGAISPGLQMRFRAMHEFTARLPLVTSSITAPFIGDSTETCMQSGVSNGMKAEVDGIVSRYRHQYPDVKILLCGGDAHFFENPSNGIIFMPELVLKGLNRILLHQIDH